jgi:uncharacterized phage protein (TIGR01671 family)
MREIKFRAWDKEKKKMWTPIRAWNFAHGDIELHKLAEPHSDKFEDEVEIMQFTGLHDKNGKEIWEGDIVRNSNLGGKIIEIKWDTHFWSAGGTGLVLSSSEKFGVEVLGNIYENPELLP